MASQPVLMAKSKPSSSIYPLLGKWSHSCTRRWIQPSRQWSVARRVSIPPESPRPIFDPSRLSVEVASEGDGGYLTSNCGATRCFLPLPFLLSSHLHPRQAQDVILSSATRNDMGKHSICSSPQLCTTSGLASSMARAVYVEFCFPECRQHLVISWRKQQTKE